MRPLCLGALVFVGCMGGQHSAETISGVVSGLQATLILSLGNETLSLNRNGGFSFRSELNAGDTYTVSVAQQPDGQTCTVSNGQGVVADTPVTNVVVQCTASPSNSGGAFAIQVQVSGLNGQVVLKNNGADTLSITDNGSHEFATHLGSGQTYSVSIDSQPAGQRCTLTNAVGQVGSTDITNIMVSCENNPLVDYLMQVQVSGLNGTLVLQINGIEPFTITADGVHPFPSRVTYGFSYAITVRTQPSGQTCTVHNGVGQVAGDVTDITVTCVRTYSISVQVSGLAGVMSLQNNNADSLTVTSNGTHAFGIGLASGQAYNVTVQTQPTGQLCTVANGSGNVANADVSNITVTCVTQLLAFNFGLPGDIPVVGDWNGDGKTETGVYRNGVWSLDPDNREFNVQTVQTVVFGLAGDIPVVGDWNGNGKSKVGVFRDGHWYLSLDNLDYGIGSHLDFAFGVAGDKPVVGDWTGNHITKVGIYRNGTWALNPVNADYNGATVITFALGNAGDIPVVGDWSGSGTTKVGVFRNSTWLLDFPQSGGTHSTVSFVFGASGDVPVVGRWNGTAVSYVGIYRQGQWILDLAHAAYSPTTSMTVNLGGVGMIPVWGDWTGGGRTRVGTFYAGAWQLDVRP